MRDCVVVGCGRSGTSLAAGMLAGAGYNCGRDLLPPDEGGPTGFFEARDMNDVNERVLERYESEFACAGGYSRPLRGGERWLAVLPPQVDVEAPAAARDAQAAAVPPSPFCCKDPRFGYTLDSWRPFFGDPLFVCVFRHPLATAESIAGQVRYGDLRVERSTAIEIWRVVYERVLGRFRHAGDWLFVHYEQLLDGTGVARLATALDAPLDDAIADRTLSRSTSAGAPPGGTAPLYEELCAAAGRTP
jgi:hypothetical protein